MNLRKKIINKSNYFYKFLNNTYYFFIDYRMPLPVTLYKLIFLIYNWISFIIWIIAKWMWLEPVFRSQCNNVGKRLRMSSYMPYIRGKGTINIGNFCRINGKPNIYFSNVYYDLPKLIVGENCSLGHLMNINISKKIIIGNHVRIGGYVFISDADGHPLNAEERRTLPFKKENIKPVFIDDDVWIGRNSIILKGVHIEKGSIIAAGSVVTKNVKQFTIVAGNPAIVVKELRKQN